MRDALAGGALSVALTLLAYIARLLTGLVGKVRDVEQLLNGYGHAPGLLEQLATKDRDRLKLAEDLNACFARVRALEESQRAAGVDLPAPISRGDG